MKTIQTPEITRQLIEELVGRAILAPSGHNTQPWRFGSSGNRILIRADLSRRLPVVDGDDHALYISLGAALENLRIAARQHGLHSDVEYFPPEWSDALVVHLTPAPPSAESALYKAIPIRQSTRRLYEAKRIPSDHLRRLEEASTEDGVAFQLFTGPAQIEPLIELVKEGNREQMRDPAFVAELISWVRFSHGEVRASGDGLTAPAMGMPAVPRWLGAPIMKAFLKPEMQAKQAEKMIRSSPALMLFAAERNDRENWVRLGQSFERVALTATSVGIKQAHMNMPCEVVNVRRQLQQHLGLANEQPLLLLRIGYGKASPRSPRRPVSAVMY
jgi:hypothetical protein